ncbi:hypothetical protein [Marinobacter sp. R17]|uniref:hypothetical protein n=1 Tax=Marinobacter sp. R17 TaxID=2484250 RepID=UPI001CC1E2C8|nr:hypothetical protein [Marinobacter sp. R17]
MRLPIVKQDGTEFENAEELSKLIQDAGDDLYLLTTQTWHGGIHISEDSAPWAKDTYPVRCIADGEVVAYRMMEDYLTSEFKGETLNYSNSFCLVRHHYEQEDDKGQTQGFTYYSLYMHLCPWKQWPSTERYRLNQRRNVRNSVPQNGQQAPAVTLPVGETFEPVAGEAIQQGQINGVAYDFMRIRMLSEGVSNNQVLATKGTDTLWIAKDETVMEQISVSRPNWIYDQAEATVKEKMNGRADPKPNKGQTGFKLAGDPAHSISAGTKIRFDAHRVQFQEIGGKARKMARCELPESGRSQWVCVEEQYIDIISETPTQLDKLYELPNPVPIRAGDTIGYLGLYEGPAGLEGGRTGNAMIHLEVFSPEDDVETVVNSKKWQDEGFKLVDGSDCDGVLDPEKVPDFFRSLCSPDEESKPAILHAEAVRERLTDSETAEERHKIVAKHNSEWWTPKSKAMMERFKGIYPSLGSLALIEHEEERVRKLGWMDRINLDGFKGALVWHLYPFSLHSKDFDDEMDKKWLIVPRGQLTFDVEGNDIENSPYFSRRPHIPNNQGKVIGNSGITFGRGLDIGQRDGGEVERLLCAVANNCRPIASHLIEWLKDGARKTTSAAYSYYQTLNATIPADEQELTRKQQHFLFLEVYAEYIEKTIRLITKPDVRAAYDPKHVVEWHKLSDPVKDVLVDLTYRGDNSPTTRAWFIPALVADLSNGISGPTSSFYKAMKDRNWLSSGVDQNRYESRLERLL